MTVEFSGSNVDVRNDADITDSPAVVVTGTNVTLRNAGFLNGRETGTIVQFLGAGTRFINEAAGNVGSDFFRSAIVGSQYADTIINDGNIRGRVDLGAGDDVYVERHSAAEVYFGDGNDRFDFAAGADYVSMYNLSLRLYGGAGDDTLNLSGYGLKLSPIVRDFEVLNVSSTLAYLNSASGFRAITLAPGGFYEFAFSANPTVDLTLQSSLSLRGTSSLRSITGSDGQEEVRLSGNVRIGAGIALGGGSDFVTLSYGVDAGAPVLGGTVDGGAGADQLTIAATGSAAVSVDLSAFRSFESIQMQTASAAVSLAGASDATRVYLSANGAVTLGLSAPQLDVYASGGSVAIAAGGIVASIVGPGGNTNVPSATGLTIVNDGRITGDVRLGNGDDSYRASGTTGGVVFGFVGNDVLIGGSGVDRLAGGDGNDVLSGGAGDDRLEGGLGDDSFHVDSTDDVLVEAVGEGRDTVYAYGSYALASGVSVEVLSVASYASTAAQDLTGNAFDNLLYGSAGANVLRGGGGADILVGLGGNDTYYVDSRDDYALEDARGGSDTVYTSVGYALTPGQEIESFATTLQLGVGDRIALDMVGNDYAQAIYGTDGANTIDGGAGADYLFGFAGDDTYIVDDAGDRVFDSAGRDTVRASVSYTAPAGIEVLMTAAWSGTAAIDLTSRDAQEIYGNEGANVLHGRGVMAGMGGADTYVFAAFDAGERPGQAGAAAVLGFVSGVDRIALDDALFAGLAPGALRAEQFATGSAARDADDRIVYDPTTGRLFYDADGAGGTDAVLFATVYARIDGGHPALGAGDFVVI